ncbi:MAG: cryptochrome/photolyase family protein [Fimbriimonadaceae bacterium]|nr:cryptochrome/photolyase family protein [Fimbriimonadaceae bacterium]
MATYGLVLGDMLFDGLPGLASAEAIFMAEDWHLCARGRGHRQKLTLFLSAMRHFRDRLTAAGRRVHYRPLDPSDRTPMLDWLAQALRPGDELLTYTVADRFFRETLSSWAADQRIRLSFAENPMFITPAVEWDRYRSSSRRLLMGDFYIRQRKRLGMLLTDDSEPVGGRWSFDEDNRRALPKSVEAPTIWWCTPDPTTQEVAALVDAHFPDHPGCATDFGWPVTHREAEAWLDDFLQHRLDAFGDYEDALSVRTGTVFHGLLTPMMNCGLLTPAQIVRATLARHAERPAPLNSLEGFLRQVVGWREFIRGMADDYPPLDAADDAFPNHFGHSRSLGEAWWTGDTGLPPVDLAIRRALRHGWAHHIERLMVLGAVQLMSEVQPAASYRWFSAMFIDGADWVMGPNVLGMSQFADGGIFATKPYLCGSSYILRMGDYAKGDWCETWDGLYWRFIHRHRDTFARNPRMSVMVRSVDKLKPGRRDRIFAAADAFIDRTTA